jgi:putative transferase (TIGR04331 family)
MQKNYLITTNLEKNFIHKKKRLYLGDWCLDRNELKTNKTITTINLNKYSTYLQNLIYRITGSLSVYLNSENRQSFSKKFWQNLIWIWVSYYISSNFYRWKKIEYITKRKKYNYANLNYNKNFYYSDVNAYKNLISNSDLYNYLSIKKIIDCFGSRFNKITITNSNLNNIKNNNFSYKYKLSFKKLFFDIYSFIFSFFLKKNIIFIASAFSIKNLIKLNFKLKQLPQFFSSYFNNETYVQILSEKKRRSEKKFNFKPNNRFEVFLQKNIVNDLPLIYLENFNTILNKIKKIKLDPKIIVSAGEHYHVEDFKIWSLYQKEIKKKKIFTVEHGGAHHVDSGQFNYDNRFSNKNISWIKSSNLDKPFNPKIFHNFIKRKNRSKIIYIGYERSKFPSRLCGSQVYENNDLNTYLNLKVLTSKMKKDVNNLFYSPKFIEDRRVKENIIEVLGKNKILKSGSLKINLKDAKFVVCEYPQTAYIESFLTVPTFLVCDVDKTFIPDKNLKKIYLLLKKNNLLFKNMDSFIKFINKNSSSVDKFWEQSKIKKIRKKFENKFSINTLNNLLCSWENFLKKQKKIYDKKK